MKKGTKTTINDNIDDNLISEAVEAAKTASQTILACGINQKNEREGVDRTTLLLSINQGKLIRKVASAAVEAGKPPIILILLSGGALDISEHKNNPNVGAILWGGYSSMYAGQAIAETIFGENSPSGRLTQTFYPESFVKNVDMDNMNMYPNNETNYPGRTYRFYNGPVVYPFGYGLSYTSFTYKIFKQENYYHKSQGNIFTFKLKVKNTGNKTAANTVLVFAKPPKELRSAMKKKLVAYVKTPELDSGQEFYPTFKIIENQHLTLFKKHDDIFPQKLNIQNQNYFWAIEFAGAENLLEVLI